MFIGLSLIQVPVTQLIAAAVSPKLQIAAALGISSHWLGYIVGPLLLQTNRWFDVTEDIALLGMLLWSFLSIPQPSTRQLLVFSAAFLWCLRLLSFLCYRIIIRGKDFRFEKLDEARAYCFFGWTSGGTWCFLNCW